MARRLVEPLRGPWPYGLYEYETWPLVLELPGFAPFRSTRLAEGHPGCLAQYRENVARQSAHLHVHQRIDGHLVWIVTHLDEWNPDFGPWSALRHFFADHPLGKVLAQP